MKRPVQDFICRIYCKPPAISEATTVTKPYGDLLPDIKVAQQNDILATKTPPMLTKDSNAGESKWN